MTFTPCHTFIEPANTTDAMRHACGNCGGDKRHPSWLRRLADDDDTLLRVDLVRYAGEMFDE